MAGTGHTGIIDGALDSSALEHDLFGFLKKVVGPFLDGFPARRQLTSNMDPGGIYKEVYLDIYGKKRYVLKIIDEHVCATDGDVVVCKVPFIPWGDVDDEWERVINNNEDPVTGEFIMPDISDDLFFRFTSRFNNGTWSYEVRDENN